MTSSTAHHEPPALKGIFGFRGEEILVKAGASPSLPSIVDFARAHLEVVRQGETAVFGEGRYRWLELKESSPAPEGMAFTSRRELIHTLSENEFVAQGRAYHLLDWTRKNRYCGRCATPTEESAHEQARVCPACANVVYPTIAPAIIVAVEREGRLLLGRNAKWPEGRYSVLAGFVEPGETLREAVKREVREEVGIEVERVDYFGSQPWPFPNSLMIGFTATGRAGEICVDGDEIAQAGWFGPGELPSTPTPHSISGRLIMAFCDRHRESGDT